MGILATRLAVQCLCGSHAAGLGAIANASVSSITRWMNRTRSPTPPTAANDGHRGYLTADGRVAPRYYVGHYVGDYDAPSWLYKAVPTFFRDPALGQVPLGWAFNPNLAQRAPQALVYARRHATTNDFFIAGNSGAGYVNVRALTLRPESGLPSGLETWRQHCLPYYRRWDLSITGFVLDGSAGAATETEFAVYAISARTDWARTFERWAWDAGWNRHLPGSRSAGWGRRGGGRDCGARPEAGRWPGVSLCTEHSEISGAVRGNLVESTNGMGKLTDRGGGSVYVLRID